MCDLLASDGEPEPESWPRELAYTAECDELAACAEQGARAVLEALSVDITALDATIRKLERFARLMEGEGDVFTSAEKQTVDDELARCRERCAQNRARMREHLDIYEHEVVLTKKTLDARQKVVGDPDVASLLEESDNLMAVVVTRHADLTRQIERATAALVKGAVRS